MRTRILVVDDEAEVLAGLAEELRRRYSADYDIEAHASPAAALEGLAGSEVALVLADHWMPGMTGAELLGRVQAAVPTAKRALLVDWGDRSSAEPILAGFALGAFDSWLAKPVRRPAEDFHRGVGELLAEWAAERGAGPEAVRVVGEQWSARSHEVRDLLSRNSVPYAFVDVDSPSGGAVLDRVGAGRERLPVMELWDGRVLVDPSNAELAAELGVRTTADDRRFDVAVVGAGPAGLAAAVYAASEGLATAVVEREAFGGQAGTSSLIRNYLGFPRGVSGTDLARRAYEQALLFGADFVYGNDAVSLRRDGGELDLRLSDGSRVRARAVVIATGVSYRRLGVPALEALVGAGVFYGAAASEAPALRGRRVLVVGGGNSAGQAAVHLARYAEQVTILVRGEGLAATMSDYLVQDIARHPGIDVRTGVEVVGGGGDGRLDHIVVSDGGSGETAAVGADALFVLIGGVPFTDWLPDEIARDRWGYVLAGADAGARHAFETTMPGVFAVGDVRHGSVKRVASSVGEGAVVVQQVHDHLRARGGPG